MAAGYGGSNIYSVRTSMPSTANFTVCGFGYQNSLRAATEQCLCDAEGAVVQLSIAWKTDGNFYVLSDNGTDPQFASKPALSTWFFWAMTNNAGGTAKNGYWCNLNATSFVTATGAQAATGTDAQLWLGNGETLTANWSDTRVAGVRVYSRTLSSTELMQESKSFTPAGNSGLVGFYPMLKGGSRTTDVTGNVALTESGAVTDQVDPAIAVSLPYWPIEPARRIYSNRERPFQTDLQMTLDAFTAPALLPHFSATDIVRGRQRKALGVRG